MSRKRNVLCWMTVIIAVTFLLPLSSVVVYASPDELDQINQEIKAKGARWHADKTSVSELKWNEKKMRLGADENEVAADIFSSTETAPIPMVTASPAALDWRNVEGVSYVSPIKNQGSCGSCWAFATTAGLESQVMIDTGGMPIDLSEQILVSCSGTGTCSGGSSASASNYIRDVGLPLESCFRYTGTNDLCSNACANWQESTYSIAGWHRASTTTITADDIRNALYAYGPIIATMYVYNDFYSYRSGVYSYTSGSYVGAHAVMVLGYDDTLQAFIVKNSWGSGWGEAGFFLIAYSEVAGTSKFGYSAMVYDGYGTDTAAPSAAITSPASGATVSGTATVSVSASDNVGVTSIRLYLDGVLIGIDSATPFTFAWNTSTASNGSHSLQAVAYDAAGNTGASTAVTVTVNNADATPPTATIVSPANGTTVSGSATVSVSASDNVGVTSVGLYLDGILIGTDTATPFAFTWNTSTASNGQHSLQTIARDAAGNSGVSTAVTVTVNNDTTPPTATIASPANGTTVSGTATVSVSASDNVGVTSVGLYLDGVLIGTDTATPFAFTWNTSTASNGQHSLQTIARDAAGNSGVSTAVTVTVSNASDTTPPAVTIASPANGATVSKIVKVKVSAADGSSLQRMEAYVDGKLLGSAACSASSCSASFNWNAGNGVAKGQHTITAHAYDAVSNKGSAAVTVYK